ncbi:pentatricopeptide repeat-containing protein At5g15300 [Asparagus officinalis]|nr:pentatricopeptide repeat-containing protein At5g15300 [Asparagus officinalis]
MEQAAIRPHHDCHLVFPFLLRACVHLRSPPLAAQLHSRIVKLGLESDNFIRNALINFHAKCGDLSTANVLFDSRARGDIVASSSLIAGYAMRGELDVARTLFDEIDSKDLVAWNVMITGYAKRGEMDKARELFDRVPEKDTVSWNVMIAGYAKCGSQDKAMEMFEEMRSVGERPDEVTMLSLISACADTGSIDIGIKLHSSLNRVNVHVGNALIDMYAKCGSIERAMRVFRGMRERDVSSWNSMIGGLAVHGHANESVRLFKEMRRMRVKPDEITFVSILVACSHGGMVDDGRRYFHLMRNEYGIEPNMKHCGCMVDMLGRAGFLDEAFEFVDGMKIEANPIIWRALLGACKVHGNVELGRRANEELLKMKWKDESGSGDYVLLSNIYASLGEWEGVEKVRRLMDDSGVMKEAGSTLIGAGRLL